MTKRAGNRPDRRIARPGSIGKAELKTLAARVRYVGSGLHKLHARDYRFIPSVNPRPSKSSCDDVRYVPPNEASRLFRRGIELGMVSEFAGDGVPKYVWAVDAKGEAYEAKTNPAREISYHGYRLSDDDAEMRDYVIKEWKRRCPKP